MIAKHASILVAVERLRSPRLPPPGADPGVTASNSLARRSPRTLFAVVATSLVLAGTLGACGQVQATRPSSTTPRMELVTSAHPRALSRGQLARRDAALLLSLVRLPPGSKRLAHEPSGDSHRLPGQSIGDPNLVDLHRFFVAPVGPWKLWAWVRSHSPRGAMRRDGYSFGTGSTWGITDEWFVSYSWPAVRTLLDNRVLVISIAALSGHRSGIRVDAQVTWLPAKPPGDRIPGGAKVLTAVLSSGLNPGEPGHPPVTTTDPAKIKAIRRFVNGLGVVSPGQFFCPVDFGQYLTITFRKKAHARPLAVVVADVSGCEDVQVQQFGHVAKPGLSGAGLVPFVERELGFT
ncbi:MAG: hypothetical protein ACLQCU_09365 [Acidimicrobiales bacterium]